MFDDALNSRLQKAALDPTQWPDTLQDLSRATGAAGAVLFAPQKRRAIECSPDQQEVLDGYVTGGWHTRDERYRGMTFMLRNGIVTEDDFIDAEGIRRSPYYREFLEYYGLRWFAGLGFNLGGEHWCVSLQRRVDQGPFTRSEVEQMRRLLVPLHDAATISQRLGDARITGMLDALEVLTQAGIICNDRGQVVAMNKTAEHHFANAVDRRSRLLRLVDNASQDRLQKLQKSVIEQSTRSPQEAATVIYDMNGVLRRIRAVTLTTEIVPFNSGARILLLMPCPKISPYDDGVFQAFFKLTASEAALAAEIGRGCSITEAAKSLGITYASARTSLKTIFSKTGVHRQAELVVLISRLMQ